MHRLLVMMFLFLGQVVCGQSLTTEAPTIDGNKFKGKVKEVRTYFYQFLPVDKYLITKKLMKKKSKEINQKKYNESGYLTYMKSTSYLKNIKGEKEISRKWNSTTTKSFSFLNNMRLKQHQVIREDKSGKKTINISISYDEFDRIYEIEKEELIDKDLREVNFYTYSYSPNEIRIIDDNMEFEEIQILDSLNRPIKIISYTDADTTIQKFDYIFNEKKNKIIKVVIEYIKGQNGTKYLYDNKGEKVKSLNLDGSPKKIITERDTLNYDYKEIETTGNTYFYKVDKITGEEYLYFKQIRVRDETGNVIKLYGIATDSSTLDLLEYEITYWDD